MPTADHHASSRAAYDAIAPAYARLVGTELSAATEAPLDRALLDAFVELVASAQLPGQVADLGCGTGRVAAFLAAQGVDVLGVDVSAGMLAAARAAHPAIRFEQGSLADLPVGDGELAGAVCWYAIIHTPPAHLHEVAAEVRRVLVPGGHVLLAFQAGGGEAVRRDRAYGVDVSLISHRHAPDEVARRLADAGLEVRARTVREPELPHESTPQAFLIARAPQLLGPPVSP